MCVYIRISMKCIKSSRNQIKLGWKVENMSLRTMLQVECLDNIQENFIPANIIPQFKSIKNDESLFYGCNNKSAPLVE